MCSVFSVEASVVKINSFCQSSVLTCFCYVPFSSRLFCRCAFFFIYCFGVWICLLLYKRQTSRSYRRSYILKLVFVSSFK